VKAPAENTFAILTAGDDGTIRTYDCQVCGTLSELVRLAESRLSQTTPR
jgi:hypothetical protein